MKKLLSIMPDFLRDPDAFFKSIRDNEDVKGRAGTLALVAIFAFMAYGFTVGLAKSPLQALSSSIKIPVLFLSTMAFCLPALYFFSLALLRTRLKMIQVVTVVLAGISVSAFLLLGLAPVTLFFVLTSTDYEFFQLLAVGFVGVSASIGVYFLWRGMTLAERNQGDLSSLVGRRILFLWILLYAFVGTQMTWRLSPFIGKPEDPFYILKPSRDNFYVDVANAVQGALNTSGLDWATPLILGAFCMLAFAVLFITSRAMIASMTRGRRPGPADAPRLSQPNKS